MSYSIYAVSFHLCSRQSCATWQQGIAYMPWVNASAHDNKVFCGVSWTAGSRHTTDVRSAGKLPCVASMPWATEWLTAPRSSVPWTRSPAHGTADISSPGKLPCVAPLCRELAVRLTAQWAIKTPSVIPVRHMCRELVTTHRTHLPWVNRTAHGNYVVCRPNCVVSPLLAATHSKEVAVGGPLFAVRNRLTAALQNPVVRVLLDRQMNQGPN
jgi:hypothetical protein